MEFFLFLSLLILLTAVFPEKSFACMTILVGKNASATGKVLVGHNEDAPGKFLIQNHFVPEGHRKPGAKIKFEPYCAELELSENPKALFWTEAKTISDNPSDSAFCDFFVNGSGVVICSNNCADSKEDKPELFSGGIGYGFRRLVAENAKSAENALEIACDLIEKYGYASSGRSYAFADFVMQIVNGKHYAVAKVPDDEAAVIPNHYTIQKSEKNFEDLISYAKKREWYRDEDGDFDFAKVYQSKETFGLEKNTYRHVKAFEILLEKNLSEILKNEWKSLPFSIKPAHKVEIETMKKILRSHNDEKPEHFDKPIGICNCDTLESIIVEINPDPKKIILRQALGHACISPYLVLCPENFEYEKFEESEKALREHFNTKPEELEYKNNVWFKTLEIQKRCRSVHDENTKILQEKIKIFEKDLEQRVKISVEHAVKFCADEAGKFFSV